MRAFSTSTFIVVFLALLSLPACRKDEVYPPEPVVYFVEYIIYPGDSGLYRIDFTDGDGDIGVGSEDPAKHLNLEYRYLDTVSGTWKKFVVQVLPDSVPTDTIPPDTIYMEFSYRIPEVEHIGNDKSLRGEINVKIPPPHFISTHTFKYLCWIYDRAGHKSNVVESQIVNP